MKYLYLLLILTTFLFLSACDSKIYNLIPVKNTPDKEIIYGDLGNAFIFKEGDKVDVLIGVSKYKNNTVYVDNLVAALIIKNKSEQIINVDYRSINLYGIRPNGQIDLLDVVDPEQFIKNIKKKQIKDDILIGGMQFVNQALSTYQTFTSYSSTTTTYDSSSANTARLRHQMENDKRSALNEKINQTLKTSLLVKQTIFPKSSIDKVIIFKLNNEYHQYFSDFEKFKFVISVADETFSGAFQNILFENKEINYENGDIYSGSTYNGKRHGHGKYIWTTGEIYEGHWRDGFRDGYGKNKWPSGEIYEGEWKDDLREGYGKNTWPEGAIYEGGWHLDLKEGFIGKYIDKEKTTFIPINGEGYFKNDAMIGKFKKITSSGEETIVTDPNW